MKLCCTVWELTVVSCLWTHRQNKYTNEWIYFFFFKRHRHNTSNTLKWESCWVNSNMIPWKIFHSVLSNEYYEYFFSWLVCERLPKPNVWHLTGSICLKWDFSFIPNLIFTKIVTKILLHYYILIRIFISIKSRSPSALDSILELLHKSIQTFLRMHIHHGNSILHPVSSCCCWHSN